jgi:hypothetical protein
MAQRGGALIHQRRQFAIEVFSDAERYRGAGARFHCERLRLQPEFMAVGERRQHRQDDSQQAGLEADAHGSGWLEWTRLLQLLHIPHGATLPADKAIPMRMTPFNSKKAYFYREIVSFLKFFDDLSKFCNCQAGC